MTTKIQTRGICQCCGREQAVLKSGLMSKHGYTVDNGWFNGVCSGQNFKPLQHDRKQADAIIALIRSEAAEIEAQAFSYETGETHPEMLETNKYDRVNRKAVVAHWDDLSDYERRGYLKTLIWKMKQRANMGQTFANDLEMRADEVHGQVLKEVKLGNDPLPKIKIGERRVSSKGDVLEVTRVDGARVYWKREKAGKFFNSWTGTAAFRRLAMAV